MKDYIKFLLCAFGTLGFLLLVLYQVEPATQSPLVTPKINTEIKKPPATLEKVQELTPKYE